jgi:hypothetical protein
MSNIDKLEREQGWHAHSGSKCGRCGELLGPFHWGADPTIVEMWGCAPCGVGVAFGDKENLDINAAADRYVAMCKTVPANPSLDN